MGNSPHSRKPRGHRRAFAIATSALVVVGLLGPVSVATARPEMPASGGTYRFQPAIVGTPAQVVAPPNGTTTGFAPNLAAIAKGGSLDLVGADLVSHNLACVKKNRKTRRPLCQSDYAALGEVKPVKGVQKLPVGTYKLNCQLHPKMTAELTVVGP
jgi:plastocyanin